MVALTTTFRIYQLALLCLFLKANKDMVVAVQTPPYNSWKDPAARIMLIFNRGLQAVGLMRVLIEDGDIELALNSCNSMKDIHELAKTNKDVRDKVIGSVRPVKQLLAHTFERLSLKGKSFKYVDAADKNTLNKLWEDLARVDASINREDITKAKIKSKNDLYLKAVHVFHKKVW